MPKEKSDRIKSVRPAEPDLTSVVAQGDTSLSRAEALYRQGRVAEVEKAVRAQPRSSDDAGVRLHIITGIARFDMGDVVDALKILHEAVDESKHVGQEVQFLAAQSLFTRESEFQAPDEALQSLSHLRQITATLGDAPSLCHLHLALARMDACRGRCVDAHRHLELARHLSDRIDGPSIRCAIDVVDASLGVIAGNISRAAAAAQSGFARAERAQLSFPMASSAGNVGLLALLAGNAVLSREYLERALFVGSQASFIRLGVLDNLAQVALFEDDLAASRGYIDQCGDVIAAQILPARSWYDFAHQVTRCALLERHEHWHEILAIVDDADPELARRQFRSLRTDLLCAKARALAALGRHHHADAALAVAVRVCPRGAAAPLITWEATKAICLSRRGQTAAADIHFDRALSACRAIGNRAQQHTIERHRLAVRGPVTTSAPTRTTDTANLGLLLGDVATILRAGHAIDLLAHRILSILQGTPLGARAEIRSESGREYRPEPSVTWESQADGTFTLLMQGSDRRVSLCFRQVESLDEISLLKSLTELVQTSVGRVTSGDADEEEQDLWPKTRLPQGEDTIFHSPRMAEVLRVALRLAATDLPILITGETGTGKEVVARMIHDHSLVKRGPFIAFNCSAIPRELVESQLFGHRRGAFTGALDSFPGVIRSAERGTLFLDEIGDLETGIQPKLLRFLESAEVHPVGEPRPHKVTVRIVAATNANLDELSEEGAFRRDLFYRLGVARISLPPLRERKDEIPALTSLFISRYAREQKRTGLSVADELIAAMLLFDWPGNIRQLANELRRIVAMAENGQTLRAADLSPEITRRLRATELTPPQAPQDCLTVRLDQTLDHAVEQLERVFIERALAAAGGRVAEAAQLLGISRKGLFLKRRRRGLVR
jgi:DNA-binding NtrC family response regulator/tetratricopeptide (TPR) repeat protein